MIWIGFNQVTQDPEIAKASKSHINQEKHIHSKTRSWGVLNKRALLPEKCLNEAEAEVDEEEAERGETYGKAGTCEYKDFDFWESLGTAIEETLAAA